MSTQAVAAPYRRPRVPRVLGPLAGILGAFLGLAFGLSGPGGLLYLVQRLGGPTLAFAFVAGLAALGFGRRRGWPLVALKDCGTTAVVLFLLGAATGIAIAAVGA